MANFLDAIKNAADVVSSVAAGAVDPNKAVGSSNTGNVFTDAVTDAVNAAVNAAPKTEPIQQQQSYAYWNENNAGPELSTYTPPQKPGRGGNAKKPPSYIPTYAPAASGMFDNFAYNTSLTPGKYDPMYSMSDEDRSAYENYFANQTNDQGLSSNDSLGDIGKAVSTLAGYSYSPAPVEEANIAINDLNRGLTSIADDSFDDGSMTEGAAKAKYMDGQTYRKYVEAGFGGRNPEEIDDTKAYNKLEEMRDYGFRPYVDDGNQFASWLATQAADDNTKALNMFANARDAITEAELDFGNGKSGIKRDELSENLETYFDSIDGLITSDPDILYSADEVDVENSEPYVSRAYFPGKGSNGEDLVIYLPERMDPNDIVEAYAWQDESTGRVVFSIPGYDDIVYDPGIESDNIAFSEFGSNTVPVTWADYADGPDPNRPIVGYLPMGGVSYTQSDGKKVDLTYNDIKNLTSDNVSIDYGPMNIAKNSDERKGWTEMLTTMDFSDFAPNFVDLVTGSAPLFFSPMAWSQAGSNAVTAAQGLDSRYYNQKDNTYRRIPDDASADQYYLNLLLSGTVPFTERIAGGIGGSGGLLGKPIQNLLAKHQAPALARYGFDTAGEGFEEVVASTWEDLQTNGFDNWFANEVVDENGNPVLDSTGVPLRDPNTPPEEKFGNFLDQISENMIAGVALGGVMTAPRVMADKAGNTGYFADTLEKRILRKIEKENGLKHFKSGKHTDYSPNITEDDIGTYGTRREDNR